MAERDPIFHHPKQQVDPFIESQHHRINAVQSRIMTTEETLASISKLRFLKRISLKKMLKEDKKLLQQNGHSLASYELQKAADVFSDSLK